MSTPAEPDLPPGANVAGDRRVGRVMSVGYQGLEIDGFVADLVKQGVDLVADVRLNAISRRPGFSKTRLRSALRDAGVEYRHLRALGNPRDNRADFHGGDLQRGRDVYRGLLGGDEARAELRLLATLAKQCSVAVMCFEADDRHCHRAVVIEELARW